MDGRSRIPIGKGLFFDSKKFGSRFYGNWLKWGQQHQANDDQTNSNRNRCQHGVPSARSTIARLTSFFVRCSHFLLRFCAVAWAFSASSLPFTALTGWKPVPLSDRTIIDPLLYLTNGELVIASIDLELTGWYSRTSSISITILRFAPLQTIVASIVHSLLVVSNSAPGVDSCFVI